MPDQHSQGGLRQLMNYTERMLAAAEAGDWDLIDELEKERSAQLKTCFSGTPGVDSGAEMAADISALIVLNDRLVASVARERSNVLKHSKSLRSARSASSNYEFQLRTHG
jgi:hypothetical protein